MRQFQKYKNPFTAQSISLVLNDFIMFDMKKLAETIV